MSKKVVKFFEKTKIKFGLKKNTSVEMDETNDYNQMAFVRPSHFISPITPLKVFNPNIRLKKQVARIRLFNDQGEKKSDDPTKDIILF